jgi:hypothetical protein
MILCISEFGFGSTHLLTVPLSQFSLYSYMITQRHLLRQDCECRDNDQQCADNLSLLHERSGCGA